MGANVGPIRAVRRRWVRWTIGAVVVVAAVVLGGPFVYFHFIEGPAPAPLQLSDAPSGSTAAPPSSGGTSTTGATSLDGAWRVASGSQAGYRVKETLFGQSNTAVGRTTAVTGSVQFSGTTVTAANFSVDLTKVTSDQSLRDSQFQGRIMDTAQYPTATLKLTSPIQLTTQPADGVTITEQARGMLKMHGVSRAVSFTVHARLSGGKVQVSASIPITFASWNIDNPSGGPATTGDTGTLEVLINLTHS
jgi:polyisoprenoid-binding protein YceI